MLYLSPVLAAVLSAGAGALLFAAMGTDPARAMAVMFLSPFQSMYGMAELGLKATPLLLCALGIAIGVRANVWNIGAEGQFTVGAIAGGGLALAFGGSGGAWLAPAMLVAGIAGGAAWAAIPALLKTRFNAHEILTTLMLSYVAVQLLGWLVHGPWQDPQGYNFPQSRLFEPDATLAPIIEGLRLTIVSPIALVLVPLTALLVRRTLAGFRIRVAGLAPGAAAYAGFNADATVWFSLVLSGALAGLAGVAEVAGPIGQLTPVISPGYGFAAIIVAFLGRLEPIGILAASLLMALLYLGGETLQIQLQLPLAVAGVLQGLLLFFLLAADVLILYRLRWVPARRAQAGEVAQRA
jgi:simple sugar transport system permease protein